MQKTLKKHQTKKGMASFYVVVFTTLLLGIIVVSFIRIIISETAQTSNNDLSQSAYDAALAGVEDAKTALLQCVKETNGDLGQCNNKKLFSTNCNTNIARYISRSINSKTQEVFIKETTNGTSTEDQAYTCLIMNNEVDSYESALNSEKSTNIVKLSARVKYVDIEWHSFALDGETAKIGSNDEFTQQSPSTPTVMLAQVIQANADFDLASLGSDLSDGTGQGTVIMYPRKGDTDIQDLADAGRDYTSNRISWVHCAENTSEGGNYSCKARLTLPVISTNVLYLHLNLPYSDTQTHYRVTQYAADESLINFKNVQFAIDSTGRANDLYRRVETRVELGDSTFPVPEYVAQISGNSDSSFSKNSYITKNCWTEKGECANYGATD